MKIPDIEFLRRVERGEIIVRVEERPGSGHHAGAVAWIVTGGLYRLRLHEEAGYVDPHVTARCAGFSRATLNEGIPARLTEKGRDALFKSNEASSQ